MNNIFASILLIINLFYFQHSFSQENFHKNWIGIYEENDVEKRLVFRFEEDKKEQLYGFMDSPDDGWMNIPIGKVEKTDNIFKFEMFYIPLKFEGNVIKKNQIKGIMTYSGVKIPISLNQINEIPRASIYNYSKKKEQSLEHLKIVPSEKVGINKSKLEDKIKIAEKLPYLNSLLIYKNDHLISENYFGGLSKNHIFNIKSVSKSILSALTGIAIEKGFLKDVNQKVLDILTEYNSKDLTQDKKELTIKHLLTMQTGLDYKENAYLPNQDPVYSSKDWVKAILELPSECPPGSKKLYGTPNTHLLSAVLTKATKMSTLDFANQYLFNHLGIKGVKWDKDPQGIYFGGSEMYLSARDLGKIGLLYQNNGFYNGKKILSEKWIKDSYMNYVIKDQPLKWYETYGYLWYPRKMGKYQTYQAAGIGGQFIMVIPDLKMTIITTANPNYFSGLEKNSIAISDFIVRNIIPLGDLNDVYGK